MHTGHDVGYTNDSLNRLVDAEEGTWGGSSIGTTTRQQTWTLTQTGNWASDQLDLNGDTDFLDTDELDDARSHNVVNEITARDIDNDSSNDFTLAYDAAGNMTDDGEAYKYEWDAFYRLRRVKNQSNNLVAEYWYNGVGYLITRHQDTDKDGDVDGSDVKFHTAYDERWRQVATFRGSDSDPKEQFVYHAAGGGGFGGSSYIDSVLLRDRDMTNDWTGSADGTLEERVNYLQNWRADVVAIVEPDGGGGAIMKEWVKYSAYGVPFALPAGDTDSDGDCDSADDSQVTTWKNAPAYDVRGDLDLDGDVDAADETLVAGAHQALGRGVLSSSALSSGVGNRKGYAGYEGDAKLSAKWHVRHRVLDAVLGRWLRRDPAGNVDGQNELLFARGAPVRAVDALGLYVLPGFPNAGGVGGQPPGSTAEECCQNAHTGPLQAGTTICCAGTMIICLYGDPGEGACEGSFCDALFAALNRCTYAHEFLHAARHADPCRPGFTGNPGPRCGVDHASAEADAHDREADCIGQIDCGSISSGEEEQAACREWQNDRADAHRQAAADYRSGKRK